MQPAGRRANQHVQTHARVVPLHRTRGVGEGQSLDQRQRIGGQAREAGAQDGGVALCPCTRRTK